MAHRKMILTEQGAQVYRTRMLSAGDPVTLGASDARLFAKHGWAEEPKRRTVATVDELPALRAEYQEKLGKRPFNGWDADTLREKIADAD